MKLVRRCTVILAVLATAVLAHADGAGTSADEVLRRMRQTDSFGWSGAAARIRMVLRERDGRERVRVLDSISRRTGDDVSSVVRFREPADVAGTAFLLLERAGQATEQWVYLPGIRRTRRIVGRERQGSFMGSDFSYADLDQRELRHVTARKLSDERLGQSDCFVIEAVPRGGGDEPAVYGKVQVWVRKADFVPLRIRFHDRAGELVKTLYSRRVSTIDGRPVILESRMQNARTGHVTDLVIETIRFRSDFADDVFSPRSLERG